MLTLTHRLFRYGETVGRYHLQRPPETGYRSAPRGATPRRQPSPVVSVKQPVPNYKWVVSLTLTHCTLPHSIPQHLTRDLVEGRRHEALAEDYEKDMYHYQVEGDTERPSSVSVRFTTKSRPLHRGGYTVGANGAMYSKDKVGFMPRLSPVSTTNGNSTRRPC